MALNVGDHFKQRWLEAPQAVRHVYLDELQSVSELLTHDTELSVWQQQQAQLLAQREEQIKRAYDERKAEILAEKARIAEQRRQQRQAALEQRLAQKRTEQQEIEAALMQDETIQRQRQTLLLQDYAIWLSEQAAPHAVKFDTTKFGQPSSIHDDLRIRLELEADYYIEQQLNQLRAQLKAAAREEIEVIVHAQSTHPAE